MYRIVHNEQTSSYRVEKRGFFGWNFVTDPDSSDYLRFDDVEAACRWINARSRPAVADTRRWKVVSECKA